MKHEKSHVPVIYCCDDDVFRVTKYLCYVGIDDCKNCMVDCKGECCGTYSEITEASFMYIKRLDIEERMSKNC